MNEFIWPKDRVTTLKTLPKKLASDTTAGETDAGGDFKSDGPVAQWLEQATHNLQNHLGLFWNWLEFNGFCFLKFLTRWTVLDSFGLLF